MSLEQTACEG